MNIITTYHLFSPCAKAQRVYQNLLALGVPEQEADKQCYETTDACREQCRCTAEMLGQ